MLVRIAKMGEFNPPFGYFPASKEERNQQLSKMLRRAKERLGMGTASSAARDRDVDDDDDVEKHEKRGKMKVATTPAERSNAVPTTAYDALCSSEASQQRRGTQQHQGRGLLHGPPLRLIRGGHFRLAR